MEQKKSTFSFIGMGMGSIALLLGLIHFWAGPFSPQPSIEQTVADAAVAIKDATIAALQGQEAEPPKPPSTMDTDKMISIATACLGSLAVIFGLFGYAKNEPLRVAGSAVVLGSSAIALQFAALALG